MKKMILCLTVILSNQILLANLSHAQSQQRSSSQSVITAESFEGIWRAGPFNALYVGRCDLLATTALVKNEIIKVSSAQNNKAEVVVNLSHSGFSKEASIEVNALIVELIGQNYSAKLEMQIKKTNPNKATFRMSEKLSFLYNNKQRVCKINLIGKLRKI